LDRAGKVISARTLEVGRTVRCFSAGSALWQLGHVSGAPQISSHPHDGHFCANSRLQLGHTEVAASSRSPQSGQAK
jgi:hypothetical protein